MRGLPSWARTFLRALCGLGLIVGLLRAPAAAAAPDVLEPNNGCPGSSVSLPFSGAMLPSPLSLEPKGDVDTYTFQGVAGSRVQIYSAPASAEALRVGVFGAKGLIAETLSPGAPMDLLLPETGPICVKVTCASDVGYDGGADDSCVTDYKLDIVPLPPLVPDKLEPNNGCGAASKIALPFSSSQLSGGLTITPSGDHDSFSFDASAGQVLSGGFGGSTALRLGIFGPKGLLTQVENGGQLNVPLPDAGTYCVTVTCLGDTGYDGGADDTCTGDYGLDLRIVEAPKPDALEPNNSCPGSNVKLPFPGPMSASFSLAPAGDVDVYSFSGKGGDLLLVGAGGDRPIRIGLFNSCDPKAKPLAEILGGGGQSYPLPADGTYNVRIACIDDVGYDGGADAGCLMSYGMDIRVDVPPPPPDPDTFEPNNGCPGSKIALPFGGNYLSLAPAGDLDAYSFTANPGDLLRGAFSPARADARLAITGPKGRVFELVGLGSIPDVPLEGGGYCAVVTCAGDVNYDGGPDNTCLTEYKLDLVASPPLKADALEPNNSCPGTPIALSVPYSANLTLAPGGDVDSLSFTAKAGDQLVGSINPGRGPVRLAVTGPMGRVFEILGGGGIPKVPLPAGSYCVSITCFDDVGYDGGADDTCQTDYTLSLGLQPAPGPQSAVGVAVDVGRQQAIVFNPQTDKATAVVPLPPSGPLGDCSITPDRRKAYVAANSPLLTAIDLLTSPPISRPLPISGVVNDTALSADGRYLIGCDTTNPGPIVVLDTSTDSQVGSFPLLDPTVGPLACNAVDVCADGTVLVASTAPASQVRRLILGPGGQLSDSGEKLAAAGVFNVYCARDSRSGIAVQTGGGLASFKVPGLQPTAIQPPQSPPFTAGVFGPTGDRFIARSITGTLAAFAYDAAGGVIGAPLFQVPLQLGGPPVPFGVEQLTLDGDGELYVAQSASPQGPPGVYVYDPKTGQPLRSITDTTQGGFAFPSGICIASDAAAPPPAIPPDLLEPNNACPGSAITLPFSGASAGPEGATLAPAGDLDAFSFTAKAGDLLVGGFSGTEVPARLAIFGPKGRILEIVGAGPIPGIPLEGGSYCVVVTCPGDSDYNGGPDDTCLTHYKLDLALQTPPPPPPPITPGTLIGCTRAGEVLAIDTATGKGALLYTVPYPMTECEIEGATGRVFAQLPDGAFQSFVFDLKTGAVLIPPRPDQFSFTGLQLIGTALYATAIQGPNGPSQLRVITDPFAANAVPSILVGPTGVGPIAGLAYDDGRKLLYGIDGNKPPTSLLTIDTKTGQAKEIGASGVQVGSLEIAADGNLYAGGTGATSGILFRIDRATGQATPVGPTGFQSITGLSLYTGADLSCPKDIAAECTSPAGANVSYDTPAQAACAPPSGGAFPISLTPVRCSAAGKSCSFNVTVKDSAPPKLLCAPVGGECNQPLTYRPEVSDLCDGSPGLQCGPPSGAALASGSYKGHCDAMDSSGNRAGCDFSVEVRDTLPPELRCPGAITGECKQPIAYEVAARDLCDGDAAVKCDHPAGESLPTGSYKASCSATDRSGNSGACSFTVDVKDTTAPTLSCPATVAAECNQPIAYSAKAGDSCDPAPTLKCDHPSGQVLTAGSYPASCSATDAAGNSGACSFTVEVKDTTPPQLGCPALVTGECNEPIAYEAKAGDSCDPAPAVTCDYPSGAALAAGSYKGRCAATDTAGNSASCSFPVEIKDTRAPRFDAATLGPQTVVGNCSGAALGFTVPKATDGCSAVKVSCDKLSGTSFGSNTVTCVATDAAGNSARETLTVIVLEPLQVVFHRPLRDDNLPNDVNTDGDIPNRFRAGQSIPHRVRVFGCGGRHLTRRAPITVTLKVSEGASGQGAQVAGGVMMRKDGHYRFNLRTDAVHFTAREYQSLVSVTYESAPAVIVGQEDARLVRTTGNDCLRDDDDDDDDDEDDRADDDRRR